MSCSHDGSHPSLSVCPSVCLSVCLFCLSVRLSLSLTPVPIPNAVRCCTTRRQAHAQPAFFDNSTIRSISYGGKPLRVRPGGKFHLQGKMRITHFGNADRWVAGKGVRERPPYPSIALSI